MSKERSRRDEMDKSGTSASDTSGVQKPMPKPKKLYEDQWNLSSSALEMEETVMKRRLLIDGANHDRRVVGLTKSFLSLCDTEDETPNQAKKSLKRLMTQLRQVEFDAQKNYIEVSEAQKSKQMNENLKVGLKEEIERTKTIISETSEALVKGREHQTKMKQCDALTRLLLQQPDSKTILEQKEREAQELRLLEDKHLAQAMALKRKSESLNTLVGVFDMVEDAIQDEVPVTGERLTLALFRPEYHDTDNESSYADVSGASPIRSASGLSECSVETMEMEENQCLPSIIEVEENGSRGHPSENNENLTPPNACVDENTETSPGVLSISSVGENGAASAADLMDEVTLGFFNQGTGEYSEEPYQPQRAKYSRERTCSDTSTSSVSVDSISP